jgi:hypothetical protein
MRDLRFWLRSVRIVSGASLMTLRLGAQDVDVPAAMHVPILMKVITFDRQLRARAPKDVVVGVVYQSGFRRSVEVKDDALKALSGITLDLPGTQLRVITLDLDSQKLSDGISEGVTHLYLTPLRAVDVHAIVARAREAQIVTMSSVPAYLSEGASLGVASRGGRPRVLVNLAASKLEGSELSAELLKLAEIVR